MKKLIIFLSVAIPAIALMAFKTGAGKLNQTSSQNDEMVDCLVKYRANWGEKCSECGTSAETFIVYFKNTCSKKLDVIIGVQEESKNWRLSKFLGVSANDTIRAYACKGTGKSKRWAREAGDNSIKFPTADEFDKMK